MASYSISQSSMLQLKAELLKKKSNIKIPLKQLDKDANHPILAGQNLQSIFTGRIKAFDQDKPSQPELQLNEKIHSSLVKKAEKYRKLLLESTYENYEQTEDDVLVDFTRMPIDDTENLLIRLEVQEDGKQIPDEIYKHPHHIELNSNSLEEIIDEFGRSRFVPRSEAVRLKRLKELNCEKDLDSNKIYPETSKNHSVHYSEDFEIRTKSVFFYRFSKNEDIRQEQMNSLRALEYLTDKQRETIQQSRKLENQKKERRKQLLLSKRNEFLKHNLSD